MLRKMLVVLCVCALSAGVISCQKLQRREPGYALLVETVELRNAIPLDYGDLVAVFPHPMTRDLFVLWFQKPDKTITVLWVNLRSGSIGQNIVTIPRS